MISVSLFARCEIIIVCTSHFNEYFYTNIASLTSKSVYTLICVNMEAIVKGSLSFICQLNNYT